MKKYIPIGLIVATLIIVGVVAADSQVSTPEASTPEILQYNETASPIQEQDITNTDDESVEDITKDNEEQIKVSEGIKVSVAPPKPKDNPGEGFEIVDGAGHSWNKSVE